MANPRKIKWIILFAALVGSVLSGAIHELGHAAAARALGLKVEHIQPFWFLGSPHVNLSGEISASGMALIDIAGMLAVVLAALFGMWLIPFKLLKSSVAVTFAAIFPALFCQCLAWCLLPWVYLAGWKVKDDVTHFIQHSGMHPLQVSAIGWLLLLASIVIFVRRTQFFTRLREMKRDVQYPSRFLTIHD